MEKTLDKQREYYQSGRTRHPKERMIALRKLQISLGRHENDLLRALTGDLGKSAAEGMMTELGIVYGELKDALRHLGRWSKQRVRLPSIAQIPGYGRVLRDPYGVVLILSPWNYPAQLSLVPLIAAVAAGNCAVLRPSSSAPETAAMLRTIIQESFPEEYVKVVTGESAVARELTGLKFDKIFFTGSPAVGREVMAAASRHLTPVTLELGGKSPVVVASDADIPLAARRIVWGKMLNAGQTCVAPDYVLVAKPVENALLSSMEKEIKRQYGEKPLESPDLSTIINRRHFDRLCGYLSSGRLICGGQADTMALKIAPTVLAGVPDTDPVMQEEIFGPILPVLPFGTMEEALSFIRSRPAPLALYLFTAEKEAAKRVMRDMAYGGGCVNDCVLQLSSVRMPFGGVGESGMGTYHGKAGFDCFSREKSVLIASTRFDVPLRYAPRAEKLGLFRRLMK